MSPASPSAEIQARFEGGVGLFRDGQSEAALKAFLKCRVEGVHEPAVHYWMALVYKSLGKAAKAQREIDALLKSDPRHVGGLAARDSLDAVTRQTTGAAKRVAFHMNRQFHYPILKPVFDLLSGDHSCLIAFESREIAEFSPDVIVICDSQAERLRQRVPDAQIVNVCHGVAHGNSFVSRGSVDADFICVTSEAMASNLMRATGLARDRLWVTGYPEVDPLFNRRPQALPFHMQAGNRTVLYAPSYIPGLSSVPMLKSRMGTLIRGRRDDISVICRPHPNIVERLNDWMAWFETAAAAPWFHITLDMTTSMAPLLMAADVIVSDVSNVALQFLALDRPIVFIDNPEKESAGEFYNPKSPIWVWRDAGEVVSHASEVAAAVSRSLRNPDQHAEARARYRAELFGDLTDGKAAERIVERIMAV